MLRALPRTRETKIYLTTALLFLGGMLDLMLGGITISAIALALTYCVMLPLCIVGLGRGGGDGGGSRAGAGSEQPQLSAALVTASAIFLLYLVTLSPDTAMWDASEYIAAAWTFGIPHPPGNPLFVIIGRAFALLPLPVGVAARVNVLAALSSAAAACMWFLVADRVLASFVKSRWQRIAAAAAAAVTGATAFTVWNQSVVNEKVYTVSLAGIAIISWLMVRWLDNPAGERSARLLILVAYLCGLGYANHMAGMLPALAVAVATLARAPRQVLKPRLLASCALAAAVGLTPFLTQPVRAGHNPAINEGGISACRTEFALGCTFSAETTQRFLYNFNRGQYGKPSLAERQAPLGAQLDMWWLYFRWQWLRDPSNNLQSLQSFLALTFFLLGLAGALIHWKVHRSSFMYFGPLMFTMTLLLIYYLNFKYGASQSPHLGDTVDREVRDRDYFYLWSFSAWGVWVATALAYLWVRFKAWPLLALVLVPLLANFHSATRHDDRVTSTWARDLLNSVEPYGVLIVGGDNDTFPLWYAQEVENVRRDVVVATTSLLRTDWHARQLIRRTRPDYDAERGPSVFRNTRWVRPSGSPLGLTAEQADSIPDYLGTDRSMLFEAHGISATIDPRELEYGIIKRDDLIVLHTIRGAWPGRPVFFSRSTGPYVDQLGLRNYMLQQGLVWKLSLPGDTSGDNRDTMDVGGLGRVDVRRSLDLWRDVYTAPAALIRRGRWVDQPSATIPTLLVALATELAWLEDLRGNRESADSLFVQAARMARATSSPEFARQIESLRATARPPSRP
jgi:hypothetical protein